MGGANNIGKTAIIGLKLVILRLFSIHLDIFNNFNCSVNVLVCSEIANRRLKLWRKVNS